MRAAFCLLLLLCALAYVATTGAPLTALVPSLSVAPSQPGPPLALGRERRQLHRYRRWFWGWSMPDFKGIMMNFIEWMMSNKELNLAFARLRWLDKQATCENMLQILYMARQQFTEVHQDELFGKRSMAYRVAHAVKRLSLMLQKLLHIHTTLQRRKYALTDMWDALVLHHKAVRVYVDFQNLYWVVARLDGVITRGQTEASVEHVGPAGPAAHVRPAWQQDEP